jgi:DNA-binding MarR family transcriptional regulator
MIYYCTSSVNAYPAVMEDDEDLGALFARLTRRLLEAERPLLEAQELSMWQYIVLAELGRSPAASQLELAQRIGYDKTRLIALIDELSGRGLISRIPDPGDRRARTVTLTERGAQKLAATRRLIRAMERELLEPLGDRGPALREMLVVLAQRGPDRAQTPA